MIALTLAPGGQRRGNLRAPVEGISALARLCFDELNGQLVTFGF